MAPQRIDDEPRRSPPPERAAGPSALLPWLVPVIMLVGVVAVTVSVWVGALLLVALVWFALPRVLSSVRDSGGLPRWMTWTQRDLDRGRRHQDR